MPRGEANGLESLARDLLDNPESVHVIIGLVDCAKITQDIDAGDLEPTARFRRIEVIRQDKPRMLLLLRRAMEERTGRTVLPFDLEEDLRNALGDESGAE